MLVVVSYDVAVTDKNGPQRLRRVAKLCEDYGQRVQFSVFECVVDPSQWVRFRQSLIDEINLETDSLRFYFLGSNWRRRIEHIGAKPVKDPDDPLVI
jgi:CRISPR-associated protein Cas2